MLRTIFVREICFFKTRNTAFYARHFVWCWCYILHPHLIIAAAVLAQKKQSIPSTCVSKSGHRHPTRLSIEHTLFSVDWAILTSNVVHVSLQLPQSKVFQLRLQLFTACVVGATRSVVIDSNLPQAGMTVECEHLHQKQEDRFTRSKQHTEAVLLPWHLTATVST